MSIFGPDPNSIADMQNLGSFQLQTCSATSTTRASFRSVRSIGKPRPARAGTLANPHWGDRHSRSSSMNFVASSMRRFKASTRFDFRNFRGYEPEHRFLRFRQMPKWAEVASSRSVIFEKVAVHVEPVEHALRNGLIAAVGHALGIVPATQVDADSHVGRSLYDRVVDRINVKINELVGIVAPRANDFHVLGVANHSQRHLVHLQIGAATRGKIRDLFAHDPREIVHELLAIAVSRAVEHRVASEKMGN